MKFGTRMTAGAVLTLMATTLLAPTAALAQDHSQKNKNNWRNLAIGAGAVGAYGLLKHDNKLGILGAAGAAYSAKRYEDQRHSQSQASSARKHYYYRNGRRHYYKGRR